MPAPLINYEERLCQAVRFFWKGRRDAAFHSSSYQQRMRILCERMMEQQLYSCASVLVAPNEPKSGNSFHLSNQTAFRLQLAKLAGHLASEADLTGGSKTKFHDDPTAYESGPLLAGKFFMSIETTEELTKSGS